MNPPSDNNRLDRIEDKLDKLTEAITAIARAEEKLIALEKDRIVLMLKLDGIDDRLKYLEAEANQGRGVIKFIWPFWAALVAGCATYIGIKH
jgi:hypothetical protein